MRASYLTLGVGVVLGAALSYGIFARDSFTHRALDAGGIDTAKAAERAPLDRDRHRERPRAELDLAALRQVVLSQALSAQPPTPATPAQEPLALARATLDQRLAGAPANLAEASRLERALKGVVDSGVLGETSAAVMCGPTMCRVDLTDADDTGVDKAAGAFAEHLPKTFASAAVYPRGTGERSLYVATSATDLRVGASPPVPEPVAVAKPSE
jgi:hypothetical protein